MDLWTPSRPGGTSMILWVPRRRQNLAFLAFLLVRSVDFFLSSRVSGGLHGDWRRPPVSASAETGGRDPCLRREV